MWEEPRWKAFCMYKWWIFIAKGKTNPWECSTSFMTIWHLTLQLYLTLHITCGSLGFPFYITLVYNNMAHSSDVAEMTHDTTRPENDCMFMLLVVSMSSCSATEWWMWCWRIIASPLHGKVCGVFDGLGVFIHSWTNLHACIIHSFVCKQISSHVFSLFISFVVESCLIHVPISAITHDETTSNPKIS